MPIHAVRRVASRPGTPRSAVTQFSLLTLVALGAVLLGGCRTCVPQPNAQPATSQAAVRDCPCDPDAPLDLPAYRGRLEEYRDSGRYEADIATIVAEARQYLERRLSEGVERPAMVLDIDETSLTNWPQMLALQFGYDKGLWHHWVEEARAEAITPTLELARWAHGEGVAIFFITGRGEDEREATARNLESVGYRWERLYLEDESVCCAGETCDLAATCKRFYREQIEAEGYTILANLGDQHSDLAEGHAERTYKVPNPFYFIP